MTSGHDWIMTASGIAMHPFTPKPEEIRIEDIAHHLAAINRFSGATRFPYSVAQHSVLVSAALGDGRLGLYGLLHDASEYVLGDVPRPLKRLPGFAAYREAEIRLQRMIYGLFGLDGDSPDDLKIVDRRMLRTEQAALMPPVLDDENRLDVPPLAIVIEHWTFEEARRAFLHRFRTLTPLRAVKIASPDDVKDACAEGITVGIELGKKMTP